jgi:glutamate--cysteine ligase
VFPEVRVKGVIEVRGADSCGPALTKALVALWKGILYDREARAWAFDAVERFSIPERRAFMEAAGRDGLGGHAPDGRPIAEIARTVIDAASSGLCRQHCCGDRGHDERMWLEPLRAGAAAGRSPADEALEIFERDGPRALAASSRCA